MTYMPFCVAATLVLPLWPLCEHGNIWQPMNASYKLWKNKQTIESALQFTTTAFRCVCYRSELKIQIDNV